MIAFIIAVIFLALLWAMIVLLNLPLWIPIAATSAIVLGAILVFAVKRMKARAAAGEIEKALTSQAEAQAQSIRPDQQAEVQSMQAEFQKAVQSLKSSKLAKGGTDALAVLPWYLIIGPPGAGKSTALRESGLQFPYRRGAVRGVGGTRNCDWWLTNDAVVLDTAGRYTTEEEDRDEWFSFLDTLARTRPKKPINGVMVAVSVADLGGETEEGVVELGKRIRERVDEVMQRLSMVLPAYLLFTKCDLMPGFVESFSDQRKNERGQIWGFTVPLAEAREAPGDLFRERFDELLGCVEQRAVQRIGQERHLDARERIYQFPQQLAALKNNLGLFVETLFAENVYQDTPIMRGVYFTSGTQEGRTVDRVMNAMAEAFGIRPPAATQEPVVEAKSYFLRDVFKKVIFPDQDVAVRNQKAVQAQNFQRSFFAVLLLAATALLLIFPIRSYFLNRELVGKGRDQVEAFQKAGGGRLQDLDPLRDLLAQLVKNKKEGPELKYRFGMYQGDDLIAPLRRLYAAQAKRLVIEPAYKQDLQDLERFVVQYEGNMSVPKDEEFATDYEKLKMHLFLTTPKEPGEQSVSETEDWLVQQIVNRWTSNMNIVQDAGTGQRIHDHARLYVELLADDATSLSEARAQLFVPRARRVLARVSLAKLALAKLLAEADGKGWDISLETMIGTALQYMRCVPQRDDTQNFCIVRGAYTKQGYENVIKKRLDDPSGLLEYWVLAVAPVGDDGNKQLDALKELYFRSYVTSWKGFLEHLQVQIPDPKQQSLFALHELTRGEPPVLPRLFQQVGWNTRIGGLTGAAGKAGGGVLGGLRNRVAGGSAPAPAPAGTTANPIKGAQDVEDFFAQFVDFGLLPEASPLPGAPPAPKTVPLDKYQEQLTLLRDAVQLWRDSGGPADTAKEKLNSARISTQGLITGREVGFASPRLSALLLPPLDAAARMLGEGELCKIDNVWNTELATPFADRIGSKYPFNAHGPDAAVADLAEFFKPGTGKIQAFVLGSLGTHVQKRGDKWFPLDPTGLNPGLTEYLPKAEEITNSLFAPGAPDVKVQFSFVIHPAPGISRVSFTVDEQTYDYLNGPEEEHTMTWPGQGMKGAKITIHHTNGDEDHLERGGDWGLFRVLEAGKVVSQNGNTFSESFNFPALGAQIRIDFRASRSQAPFFYPSGRNLKLLSPFRLGPLFPSHVATGCRQ